MYSQMHQIYHTLVLYLSQIVDYIVLTLIREWIYERHTLNRCYLLECCVSVLLQLVVEGDFKLMTYVQQLHSKVKCI